MKESVAGDYSPSLKRRIEWKINNLMRRKSA